MLVLLLLVACPSRPTLLEIGIVYDAACTLDVEECADPVYVASDPDDPTCDPDVPESEDSVPDTSNCTIELWNSHKYLFCQDPQSQEDASDFCDDLGMNLVSLGDKNEADWVVDTADQAIVGNPWIGLTRPWRSYTWYWESGEDVSYTEWNPGEPNNSGSEFCAEFYLDGMAADMLGAWNNTRCTNLRNPICESW